LPPPNLAEKNEDAGIKEDLEGRDNIRKK